MASRWVQRMVKGLIFGIIFLGIFAAGFAAAVLHLWNWLMPALFGLHTITYWQAVGLLGPSRILFPGPRGWMGGPMHWHGMRRRWEIMTPEDPEKLRAGVRGRCAHVRLS